MSSRLNELRRRECQKASLGVEGRVGRREFGWNAWRYLLAQGDLPRDGSTLRRGSWVGKLISAADAKADRLGCVKKVRKQSDPSVSCRQIKRMSRVWVISAIPLEEIGEESEGEREKKTRSQNKVTVAAGRQKECSNNQTAVPRKRAWRRETDAELSIWASDRVGE